MIRPIQKTDSWPDIAALLYATDDFLMPYLFGPKDRAIPRLIALIKAEDNAFSYRYITGFFDGDTCAGIRLAYSQKNKPTAADFYHVFKGIKGLFFGLKTLLVYPLLSPPIKQSLYLQSLSVKEDVRGRGIGKKLLRDLETTALQAGFDTVSLDVTIDNEKALRLYLSEGYQLRKKRRLFGFFPVVYYCEKKVSY